ncbi:MAG TPA: c-type cytochrome [Bryobacteraceae bacterium]|nr:c-type cytochrome [Bryobacteraceae bacterium]
MSGMGWIAVISVLMPASCVTAAGAPLAVCPISDESLAQMQKRHPLGSVEVDDPVYKRKQRYQGFWLRDLFKELSYAGHPESDVYVRFRCKDGYAPIMPLSRALKGEGLIAVRDLGAPPGKNWELLPAIGQTSTPAPSYLVWVSPPGDLEEYPWPYQIVAIELASSADVLGAAVPDDSRRSGFDLFVRNCLKCHAINGVGGTLGPELNSPCSVTQYWNPGFLSRFIANASSIRAGTKMPDFHAMPGNDIQAIIEYLQYMGSHKKPGATCPSER